MELPAERTRTAADRVFPQALSWRRRALASLGRGVLLGVLTVVALSVALAGAFMHRWLSPLGMVLAIGGAAGVTVLARHASRTRLGVGTVGLAWLAPVLVLSGSRPAGDVVITGDATGLTFLFGGSVAVAVTLGLGTARRRTRDEGGGERDRGGWNGEARAGSRSHNG